MPQERLGYRPVPELTPGGDEPTQTQAARAHAAIRRKILTCALKPGALVNERALMEGMGFGRTPVREALLRLASERLVVFKANQSIQVAPVGFEEVRELYEVRLHSERLAWRLWHRRRTEADIQKLAHCFDAAETIIDTGRPGDVVNLDFDFHAFAWKNADNRFLAQHLYNLGGLSYRLWHLTADRTPAKMRELVRSHDPIFEAFREDDEDELDRRVAQHVSAAYHDIMEGLKGRGLAPALSLDVQPLQNDVAR